jgi:hypothetical protein
MLCDLFRGRWNKAVSAPSAEPPVIIIGSVIQALDAGSWVILFLFLFSFNQNRLKTLN